MSKRDRVRAAEERLRDALRWLHRAADGADHGKTVQAEDALAELVTEANGPCPHCEVPEVHR